MEFATNCEQRRYEKAAKLFWLWKDFLVDIGQICGKAVDDRKRVEWRNASKRVVCGGNSCEDIHQGSNLHGR